MANSNWNKKDSAGTSSSREESGGMRGSPSGSEKQDDGFETEHPGSGRNTSRDSGLDDSRDRGKSGSGTGGNEGMSGSSGSSGSTGLGGETSEGSTSRPGGVEGTSERDGREDPDRASRR